MIIYKCDLTEREDCDDSFIWQGDLCDSCLIYLKSIFRSFDEGLDK